MSEKYFFVEPLKKGVEVSLLAEKMIFEAVKPLVGRRMTRGLVQFLDLISGI